MGVCASSSRGCRQQPYSDVSVLTAGKTLAKWLLKPNYNKVRHVVFLYVLTAAHFRHHKKHFIADGGNAGRGGWELCVCVWVML